MPVRFNFSSIFIYFLFIPFLIIYHVAEAFKVFPELKAGFYFLPLAGFITVLILHFFYPEEKIDINLNSLKIFFLYLVLLAICLFFVDCELYTETLYRDIVITSLPLLFFAFQIRFTHRQFVLIFVTAILCYLIWVKFQVAFVLLSSLLVSNYYFVSEYHFGTVAGIFFIYFFYKKNYFWLALSIVLILFVNKRASMFGIMVALPVYYLILNPLKIKSNPLYLFWFMATYYFSFYIVGMNLVPLVELFLKLIDKEYIDVDYFLTGRALLNNAIRPEIFDRDIISFFFGNGPGQAEYYIFKVIKHRVYDFQTKPFLVHNDFLKLHFDLGLFGVILYFFMMYVLYCRSNAGILMFLYTVPLFLIDNTIIFSYNILVACVAANIPDEKPALLSK